MKIAGKEAITVVVQIGNSDDKLPQYQWAQFYDEVNDLFERATIQVHFSGCSNPSAKWQNACFVGVIYQERIQTFTDKLNKIRFNWLQDSIALTVGSTHFVDDQFVNHVVKNNWWHKPDEKN